MKHVHAHEVEGIRAPAPNSRTLKHLLAPWTTGSEQLWIGLSEIDSHSCSNPHSHPNEEAFFVISGYGDVVVGDEREQIGPGSAVLVPGGTTHQLVNTSAEVLRVLCSVAPAFDRGIFDQAHDLEQQREES